MSSKDEFIIKRSDSTTDIFRKWDEFITAAKAAKLIDIFNGKTSVKSDEEVEADNKSRLSYLKTALIKQTLIQESNLTIQIMQEIEANELYAYFYATDIIAVDPNFPTEEEWVTSRSRILYNQDAYTNYLYKCGEEEIAIDDPARDIQCQSIRPGNYYIGYGSNNIQEALEAQNVVRIRNHQWRRLAEKESKVSPAIERLHPTDTAETISNKLTEENKSKADTEYSKNSKHYEAEKLRVAGEHASIIHFLSTTVDGIEGTAAAPLIRAKKYDQILESIRSSYGCIQSPKACNDLQVELGMITLGDDETVNQFVHRIRNLVANIQVISESLENKNPRLTFSQAYEGSTYTEEKWKLHFATSTQYTGHLALLHRIIVGINDSRLKQVAYDFNVQVLKVDQTIERLLDQMIIGETALPIGNQVVHQFSSVTTTNNGNSGGKHFCSYHSFGGVQSTHDTKDCNLQKQGLTTVDPTNSKWQVLQSTGDHFIPRPRTPLPNNSSGNKRKGNNASWQAKPNNPSGKPCYKCLQLKKEGESIPDWITTNHTADKCTRTKLPKFKKTNASFARDNDSKHDDGTLSKAAVNQIVQAMQASATKPAKARQQVLIQNGEDGYFVPGSS